MQHHASKKMSTNLVVRNVELIYLHLCTNKHSAYIIIIIGSTYVATSADFEKTLEEWQHLITQRGVYICKGDLSHNSALWSCSYKDLRCENLPEHLVTHNLAIANVQNTEATFVKVNTQGHDQTVC